MRAEQYDLAIVGGGVFGCMIAHQYARQHPSRRVALFERRRIGQGCSGYAGAIATPAVRSAALRAWSDHSADWYRAYGVAHSTAPLWPVPILYVSDAHSMAALAARLPAPPRPAPHAAPSWLCLGGDEFLLEAGYALHADVAALCHHLLDTQSAIEVFECAEVAAPERVAQAWQLTLSDGRTYFARQLVQAKGAWLAHDARYASVPVRTKKIVAYLLDAPAATGAAAIYFPAQEAFLLPLPVSGQWLLSITSSHWDCAPESPALAAGPADLVLAEAILERHAPALRPRLRGARVSCDSYSPSWQPVAAIVDDAVLAYGGSGSGFRYAPALAAQALQLLEQQHCSGRAA